MLIQLHSDHRVHQTNPAVRHAAADLERSLQRFAHRITRLEVHFQDLNADKSADGDKRCAIEARVRGQDPFAVSNTADTLSAAFAGARDKLITLLDRRLGRLRPPKGADPFESSWMAR